MTGLTEIPLFPLDTVLLPDGFLPLRIFERRYLDMIRECSRNDSGFGVCLLLEAETAEHPVQHAAVGTLAMIRDFYTLKDGLLGITCEGTQRFLVTRTRSEADGLLIGAVEWLTESPPTAIPESYGLLVHIAERLLEKLDGRYPGFTPDRLLDAAWVSYRLTEWLPLDNPVRQCLLELNDPLERLRRLLEAVPGFQEEEPGE